MSEHEEEQTPIQEPSEDETGDEEEADEEESTPEVGGLSAAVTPEEMEERFDKVSRSFKTYQSSIDRNLEEHALDLLPCPLCFGTPHPAFVNKHDLGRVPEEVVSNVRMFIGDKTQSDYPAHPTVHTCDVCQGLGKVQTGSRVPEHAQVVCPNCKGYGYTPPPQTLGATVNGSADVVASLIDHSHDVEEGERDMWMEPRVLPDGTLNENYGKLPQHKHPHPIYGVTAGMNVAEHMLREN